MYLVRRKTPHTTINNETIAVGISRDGALTRLYEYRNTAGATPKDTTSESESMFFPNSNSSILLVLREIHPSIESKSSENIIKILANRKSCLMDIIIDRTPEAMFINETKSDIATKLCILVFINLYIWSYLLININRGIDITFYMKVCLYGSGSKRTPKELTDVGYELGLRLAQNNHSLVFGGGNDGMMGAVAKGVFDNGGKIMAIAPEWINEFDDPFRGYDEYIKTDSMDERKKLFLEKSDVFVIVPGGIGTLDEFFEVLTLKYLNRHSKKIILFNINHFYDMMIEMLNRMHDDCLIREGALDIFVVADSIDEVFEYIMD